jgi:hypothetical protein
VCWEKPKALKCAAGLSLLTTGYTVTSITHSLQAIGKPKRHARFNWHHEIQKQPDSKPQQNLKGENRAV